MTSLQFFKGFSVHRTSSISETAEWLINMSIKIDKKMSQGVSPYYSRTGEDTVSNEIVKTGSDYCSVVKKVKKDNVTPENIGEIILCQIPGISSVTAIAIMKQFGTFPKLILELQTNPSCLENLSIETNGKVRKISKTSLENIRKYLV